MFSRWKSNLGLWLAALACGLAALCCQAQQDAPTLVTVEGTVVDGISHQPIARVLVNAHSDAALTDNDGHFELHLPPGDASVEVRRPGYHEPGNTATMNYGDNTARVAQGMAPLIFTLIPNGIITGRVALAEGDDSDGVRVTLYTHRSTKGYPRWVRLKSAETDSEGTFRFAELPAPAEYMLLTEAVHRGAGTSGRSAISSGYAPQYYPGTSDAESAGVLSLQPGQQAEADFQIAKQPFYPVTLVPEGPAEQLGYAVSIQDSSGRTVDEGAHWNRERGTLEMSLPNGRYHVQVRSTKAFGTVDFLVAGAPLPAIRVSVLPLSPMFLRIHREIDPTKANGGGIFITGNDSSPVASSILTTLIPDTSFIQDPSFQNMRRVPGSTDQDIFEIENVLPGRYRISAVPLKGYVSAISQGNADLTENPLIVGAGGSALPIDITLRGDGGSIEGTVRVEAESPSPDQDQNQDQASSAAGTTQPLRIHVYAVPLFPTVQTLPAAFGHDDGHFRIEGVPPGTYQVLAFDTPQDISPSDAQQMAQFAGKGQTVKVEANGSVHVDLELIRSMSENAAGSSPE